MQWYYLSQFVCTNKYESVISISKWAIFIYIKNTILSFARRYNQMLEKTEGAIKNGQSRETGNIGYTIIRIVEIWVCEIFSLVNVV
jgi:hypothetical protein